MDATDRRIIELLGRDGRMSISSLAGAIPLSISATSMRMKRLRDSGVIDGFSVRVNPMAAGKQIEALVDLRLATGCYTPDFYAGLREIDAVIDAVDLSGSFDVQLRIAARNVEELNSVLTQLRDEMNAVETNTRIVLHTLPGFPRPVRI